MYRLLKPLLFLLTPERAHHVTVRIFHLLLAFPLIGNLVRRRFAVKDARLKTSCFGLDFPNPVGLAAGFDKDGKYYRDMSALGFGFIEIGTVTPKPQSGNPQPRLFRLTKSDALINRMGFNNEGVDAMVDRLRTNSGNKLIIGGNIGKNKTTPNAEAIDDYSVCFEKLFPHVDYFVVNVSSPNTPNLRALQEKEPLQQLLSHLQTLNSTKPNQKPILLKIAPDLTDPQLEDIVEIILTAGIAGVIATNTTISRENLKESSETVESIGAGGLSGKPVRKRSLEVIRYLAEKSEGRFPIIGVGGIHGPEEALEKIAAGASLVQVYTGLIYQGPRLVRDINQAILRKRVAAVS